MSNFVEEALRLSLHHLITPVNGFWSGGILRFYHLTVVGVTQVVEGAGQSSARGGAAGGDRLQMEVLTEVGEFHGGTPGQRSRGCRARLRAERMVDGGFWLRAAAGDRREKRQAFFVASVQQSMGQRMSVAKEMLATSWKPWMKSGVMLFLLLGGG